MLAGIAIVIDHFHCLVSLAKLAVRVTVQKLHLQTVAPIILLCLTAATTRKPFELMSYECI